VRTKQKSTDVNYLLTPDHWFWLVDDEDATRRPLISRKSHHKSREKATTKAVWHRFPTNLFIYLFG